MGQRYRVVLELSSNFEGEPDKEVEVKTIKNYLESIAGVGAISVQEVEPMASPNLEAPVESIPIPVVVETVPGPPPVPPVLSWTPESPTRKDVKRLKASKRPKKM